MFAVALASCIAPTLPVPPPSEPESVTLDAVKGKVTIVGKAGSVEPGATVHVTNYTLQNDKVRCAGTCAYGWDKQAETNGSYAITVDGQSKDLLYLTQLVKGGESGAVEIKVP